MDAWAREERGWDNRLHGACKALLDDIAESPNGPHLVLVDSLGVGPQARARMVLAGCTFERLVAVGFQAAPDNVELSPLTTPRDRQRHPPPSPSRAVQAHREQELLHADRRSSRLGRGIPLADRGTVLTVNGFELPARRRAHLSGLPRRHR